MARNNVFVLLVMLASALVAGSALAAEPSLHQVYQAAEAGRMNDAQAMMHEVLQVHPNSGKAHYVEAELLVKQGQLNKADSELLVAERLAPGLPFAQPQSVQNLKTLLGKAHSTAPGNPLQLQSDSHKASMSIPWGMLFVGLALVAFILWAVSFMKQRSTGMAQGAYFPHNNTYGAVNPNVPQDLYPQSYGAGGFGAVAGSSQGLGARVMGGLATGAAVGAGVVAGEALMHHFMDGNGANGTGNRMLDLGPANQDSSAYDLGSNDFGVTDNGGWDDSSDNSSDWN